MTGEEYPWEMVNMIKGPNNREVIKLISNKEKWKKRTDFEREIVHENMKGKI